MIRKTRTSPNLSEINQIETELRAQGYRKVLAQQELKQGEYKRSEFSGSAKSFKGQTSYIIEWCIRG